jgi:hypothetical protein
MFSVPVDARVPGFRVGQPGEVPGFRLADDGSIRNDAASAGASPQYPGQWTSKWAGPLYVDASGRPPDFFDRLGSTLADVPDAADWVGTRANAVVNGAYSVFPGTYNALRAVARGAGLLGPEEFRRFGQEADAIGNSLGRAVKYPDLAYHASLEAARVALESNPLLPYYSAGRGRMGFATRLGGAATAGDALRAVENGHDLIDAIIQYGISGIPHGDR